MLLRDLEISSVGIEIFIFIMSPKLGRIITPLREEGTHCLVLPNLLKKGGQIVISHRQLHPVHIMEASMCERLCLYLGNAGGSGADASELNQMQIK